MIEDRSDSQEAVWLTFYDDKRKLSVNEYSLAGHPPRRVIPRGLKYRMIINMDLDVSFEFVWKLPIIKGDNRDIAKWGKWLAELARPLPWDPRHEITPLEDWDTVEFHEYEEIATTDFELPGSGVKVRAVLHKAVDLANGMTWAVNSVTPRTKKAENKSAKAPWKTELSRLIDKRKKAKHVSSLLNLHTLSAPTASLG